MGTSKSAAFAAMPDVTQPASAISSVSIGAGPLSTPPRPGGASVMRVKRRVRGVTALPATSCVPTSTSAFVPRCHVERSLTVRLASAGFSRICRSSARIASTFTSLIWSAMMDLLSLLTTGWR
jgi:hypothetical protein